MTESDRPREGHLSLLDVMFCRRWGRRLGGLVRGIRMGVRLSGGRRSFGFSSLGGGIGCESIESFTISKFGFFFSERC